MSSNSEVAIWSNRAGTSLKWSTIYRLLLCLPLSLILFICVSCSLPNDEYEPIKIYGIKVDKPSISFKVEGGIDTIVAPDVHWGLSINHGIECALVDGEWREGDYTYSTDSKYGIKDILEGSWFHAYIPNSGKSNEMIVSVDTNYTDAPRRVKINIGVIPDLATIVIDQQ